MGIHTSKLEIRWGIWGIWGFTHDLKKGDLLEFNGMMMWGFNEMIVHSMGSTFWLTVCRQEAMAPKNYPLCDAEDPELGS